MTAHAANLSKKIRQASWSNLLMPRLEDILFLAIFIAVIGLGPRLLKMDGDLGRHLTIGNYILDNFTIPTRDIFSHTMGGLPLTPHEWLAQVVYALSYRLGGLDGVVILCALLIASTFTLVFRQSIAQSKMLVMSLVVTILAAAAASIHWLARPHLFTMLFTILWIGELEKWRTTGRWRWWILPILMLVWVNFHGAFIVGLMVWVIYLIDHLISKFFIPAFRDSIFSNVNFNHDREISTRMLILVGSSFLLMTLVNPVGWRIWDTTFGFLQNQYLVSHTVEYQSPDFQQISYWPFLMMICLSILLTSLHGRRMSITAALLLTTWTAFGLVSARNIAIYAVVAAPLLASVGSSILRESDDFKRIINFDLRLQRVDERLIGYIWPLVSIMLVGWILLSGAKLDFNGAGNEFSKEVFPVEAVDWISEQPENGPVFNYFPWGGYLLYRSWPQQQVFIDGQTDFYGESLTRQYEKVITLSAGWQEILDQYHIRWLIMPTDSELARALNDHPEWEQKYLDETAAIYFAIP
jgi:hypothetical protein